MQGTWGSLPLHVACSTGGMIFTIRSSEEKSNSMLLNSYMISNTESINANYKLSLQNPHISPSVAFLNCPSCRNAGRLLDKSPKPEMTDSLSQHPISFAQRSVCVLLLTNVQIIHILALPQPQDLSNVFRNLKSEFLSTSLAIERVTQYPPTTTIPLIRQETLGVSLELAFSPECG